VKKKKALMIQGTGSNVGKSLIATALCRIFLEDGFSVAPFKVQNMALNAFVTRDGLEMSRAQALQAQACRTDPDVRMNPVLIKPASERKSQVVVLGKAIDPLNWSDYTRLKPELMPMIQSAYRSLSSGFDIMVLEGAGSPAEINLMKDDIVNMKAAEMADAPVLLVGDIDAGGVFASFVGTLALLPPEQAFRIKGLVLNKFRGDRAILAPGLEQIRKISGRPVAGVIPYLEGLLLPEEDSVSFKTGRTSLLQKGSRGGGAEVCRFLVLDLPRISNFTDFDPFFVEPDVDLQVLRRGMSLNALPYPPDVVIIPGSKNVVLDLNYLRENRLDRELEDFVSGGGMVVGLCGGLQMLGKTIEDPWGVENEIPSAEGLGFLKMKTVFNKEKILKTVAAKHLLSGLTVKGFEIHQGRSVVEIEEPSLIEVSPDAGAPLGWIGKNGQVWGTYIHGLFDSDPFRRWFVDRIREKKGWAPLKSVQGTFDIESSIQYLAREVRKEMDMDFIYRIMAE
jgi:adenosylcobyric acid synthase